MTLLLKMVNRVSSVEFCHKDLHLRCCRGSESSTVPCTDVISRIFYFGIDQIRTPIQAFNGSPKYFFLGITVPSYFYPCFVLREKLLVLLNRIIYYSESKYIVSNSFLRVTFDAYAS